MALSSSKIFLVKQGRVFEFRKKLVKLLVLFPATTDIVTLFIQWEDVFGEAQTKHHLCQSLIGFICVLYVRNK